MEHENRKRNYRNKAKFSEDRGTFICQEWNTGFYCFKNGQVGKEDMVDVWNDNGWITYDNPNTNILYEIREDT